MIGYRLGYALGVVSYALVVAAAELKAAVPPSAILAAPTFEDIIFQLRNLIPIMCIGASMGLTGAGAMALTKIDTWRDAIIRCMLGFLGGLLGSLVLWQFVTNNLIAVIAGSAACGSVAWPVFRYYEAHPEKIPFFGSMFFAGGRAPSRKKASVDAGGEADDSLATETNSDGETK